MVRKFGYTFERHPENQLREDIATRSVQAAGSLKWFNGVAVVRSGFTEHFTGMQKPRQEANRKLPALVRVFNFDFAI
jgi:hypothetical protein